MARMPASSAGLGCKGNATPDRPHAACKERPMKPNAMIPSHGRRGTRRAARGACRREPACDRGSVRADGRVLAMLVQRAGQLERRLPHRTAWRLRPGRAPRAAGQDSRCRWRPAGTSLGGWGLRGEGAARGPPPPGVVLGMRRGYSSIVCGLRWSTRFGTPGFGRIARYTTMPSARALFSTPSEA
jgi:hypothetical protein